MQSPKQKWTAEEDGLIKDFINKAESEGRDISMKDVAALLPHRTFTCVKQHVYSVIKLQVVGNKPWTPEEDAVIRELYMTTNARDVADKLSGRNLNAVKARANLLGIIKQIDYEKDTLFFNIPNAANCAIAGFIAADGNIQKDKMVLNINISTKDEEFLKTICGLMGFNGKFRYRTVNRKEYLSKNSGKTITAGVSHMCSVAIHCSQWCDDLNTHWNITPRKTATLMPPDLKDNRLKMAFISGLACGDGWICKTVNDSGYLSFGMGFTGTKDLLEWVQSTFNSLVPNMDAKKLSDNKSPNCRDYCVWGATFYWLAKMFLSLDIPRLERKWDLARMFVARVEDGRISTKMLTQIEKKRPTDAVLAEFGIISQLPSQISPLAV